MSVEMQQMKRFNSMERRPRMLKEFLSENSSNSCSSSGFKSLPRKPNDTNNNNDNSLTLIQRERKNSSSNNYYSPFQTLINTITAISFFTAVKKSPSINFLPRSLSRKLSSRCRKKRNQSFSKGSSSTVKIKDIIRWKSFRDHVEEHHDQQRQQQSPLSSPSLDFHPCTVGSTATTTTTTTFSSTSSWCDSDFTSGYLSPWEPRNDSVNEAGKKFSFSPLVVGKDKESVEPATGMAEYTAVLGAKEVLSCQEYEQQSPVSVLQVGDDEFSLFDQSLATIERRKQKFMQTIQRFESLGKFDYENSSYDEEEDDDHDDEKVEEQNLVKERARKLLHYLKATHSMQSYEDYSLDTLLLDFLMEELTGRRNQISNDDKFEREILRKAEDWLNGSFGYDIEHVNKDTYIKDMDRRSRWSMFEEEKEELALEIETAVLHSLVADLLDLDG